MTQEISSLCKQRIEQLCEQKDISLYKLARVSEISASTLYNMLKDNRDIKISTIKKICDALKISLKQFFDCDLFF